MTRPFTFLLLVASAACSLAQIPPHQTAKMGNGLTVILVEDHKTRLTAVDIWVKAGTVNETRKTSGVSHFIEHLAFGATAKYDPGEMDMEMESLGATLDARTSKDWVRYGVTVMSSYLPKALLILSEAVVRPQFRAIDVERERLVILEELAKKQTEPFKVCRDHLAAELYGDHPYALPLEGMRETVRTLSANDIVSYHRKYYRPERTAVVIVGDFEPQAAISAVGKAFQGYSSPQTGQDSIPEPVFPTAKIVRDYRVPYKLDYVGIGFPGPPACNHTEVCAADILLTYLGSGYRSWISAELKGRTKLIEEGHADYLTQLHPGLVAILASTVQGKSDQARQAIIEKITEVRSRGIPAEGLAMAKRSLLGQYAFQNETGSGVAQSFGFYHAISQPEFALEYIACIRAITNDDIVRTAQKYLDPERAVIVTMGPDREEAQ